MLRERYGMEWIMIRKETKKGRGGRNGRPSTSIPQYPQYLSIETRVLLNSTWGGRGEIHPPRKWSPPSQPSIHRSCLSVQLLSFLTNTPILTQMHSERPRISVIVLFVQFMLFPRLYGIAFQLLQVLNSCKQRQAKVFPRHRYDDLLTRLEKHAHGRTENTKK